MRAALFVVASAFAACAAPPAPVAPGTPPPPTPVPVATPVADPPPPALRLPGDVKPTQYALELTIIPDQPTATGRVQIAAEVVRPTRVIWLNGSGLTVASASLGGAKARVLPGGEDFIGLTVDRDLPVGPLAIEVAFGAPIDPTKSRGLYSEREGNDTYAYTFFEPLDARRAFPCFDEPNYKVPWQLTFHVKADHVALANAPVTRETPEPGGMKKVELAVSKPLPSYLVAFVVGPFELVDGGTAGRIQTPIRFIIPKGRAGELGYAKEVTPKVVVALEDYFDMPYPYVKLDVAVVPRFWGTMEHPGIVAMGQPLTLIRPDQATRGRKHSYANILAHEMSHYWFGDLVTMAWWDDTWLNEALGEWSDMNITEAAEPTWRVRDDRIQISLSAMSADETLSASAIRRPVATREAIQASFDNAITYAKGASVFRMFESLVGRDVWRTFINGYLKTHAWGNASADDFLRSMTEHLGPATTAATRTFLDQPGVPRISAKLSCQAGQRPRVELAQTRALPAGVTDPSSKLWTVPVCMRYGDATHSFHQCSTLATASETFDLSAVDASRGPSGPPGAIGRPAPRGALRKVEPWLGCPTWMILNADAVGYYRSVVDPAVVRALLTPSSPAARAARPTPAERMMLIYDVGAGVDRGEISLDQKLALVPLVAADPDDKVARDAVAASSMPFDADDEPMYQAARRWYQRTFRPRGRQLGWQRAATDSEERHDLRRLLIGIATRDDPALTAEATRLADRWLVDRTGLDDDLVGAALSVAARKGDAARFDRYLAAAKAARDRSEKLRIVGTLAAFEDPALAQRALGLVLDPAWDLRETRGIVLRLMGQRETRDLAMAFVEAHLDDLLARMRDDDGAGFLSSLASATCNPRRKAKIAALVAPRAKKIDGAENYVTRALEHADQCIAQTARQRPAVRKALGLP